ncbi:MAG TPA: YdcF family protein [Phototrophicaceae bacterium]|nr:YdcF family protein [Phototrophicaceae bacterium]
MSGLSTERGFWLRHPRLRRIRRIVLILLGVWLIGCVLLAGVVYVYGLTDRAQPEDVIIVLGSGLAPDLSPSPGLIRRADHAADLWKAHYAPQIICSGGYTSSPQRSEADGCAQVLQADGVPAAAIILEKHSRSTEENAFYSRQIMAAHGWKKALVVSDGFHLLRATWIFAQQGVAMTTSPCALPPFFTEVYDLGREVVGLHWQLFKSALNLPITYVPWV